MLLFGSDVQQRFSNCKVLKGPWVPLKGRSDTMGADGPERTTPRQKETCDESRESAELASLCSRHDRLCASFAKHTVQETDRAHSSHSVDEETNLQGRFVTCPRSHS